MSPAIHTTTLLQLASSLVPIAFVAFLPQPVPPGSAKSVRLRRLVLAILPLLLGFDLLLWRVSLSEATRGASDFRQWYVGGYMIRTGHGHELYAFNAQRRFEDALVPSKRPDWPITHPAFEELLFVPLSLHGYRHGYLAFMALNVALLGVSGALLSRTCKADAEAWNWLPALLIVVFCPISRTLLEAQDSIMMLTLLAGALWCLRHDKERLAGVLAGVGMFKYQIVVPIFVLFFLWRRWRFVFGYAVSSCLAGLISLYLVGLSGARQYFHALLSAGGLRQEVGMPLYGAIPRSMANLHGLLSAMFDPWLPHPLVGLMILASSAVVVMAAARQRPSLPLAIVAAELVSYYFLIHDASILVIPLVAAFDSESLWSGACAIALLFTTMAGILDPFGYITAIPLLGLFVSLLMLSRRTAGNEHPKVAWVYPTPI